MSFLIIFVTKTILLEIFLQNFSPNKRYCIQTDVFLFNQTKSVWFSLLSQQILSVCRQGCPSCADRKLKLYPAPHKTLGSTGVGKGAGAACGRGRDMPR
jgi:hypothetical protein